MRLLSRLLVILAVCLVSVALPAASAQADSGGPYITLDPDNGVIGTNVTIRGSNFTANTGFDIYYYRNTARVLVVEVETNGDGYFKDSFIVPESYKGVHEVRAYIGNNKTATGNFTVEPGLTVNPEKGLVGTDVTVEGHGFAQNEKNIELRYYLNGNYTTIASNIAAYDAGNWAMSFEIPPSAMGDHRIDAKGNNSTLTEVKDATFEVTPGINLDKSSGSVGENIMIAGNGFYINDTHIKILFAGQEVETKTISADAKGYWQESFTVPEMPKGMYTVTAYGKSTPKETISAFSFAIKPDIVLFPAQGYVGMNLIVIGRGFAANKDVFIKYDGSPVATDATDNNGSFDVSFAMPKSQHGEHQVTAADAALNNAIAIFTMESNAPGTPTLTSPPDGGRVGFIGKVRPTLEWSGVSDPSGVYYSLQIATSTNVTATGEFVHPLVSVEGLVETSYTLNETDALSYGTYYWIVQALDGAENAGNWTAAHSFRAGLLPMWGFIAAIVGIVVLIGALVYFLVRRRRTHYY